MVASLAALASDVQRSTERTVSGLVEQAHGALEVAKALDGARKEAAQAARAIAEQTHGATQLAKAAKEVAKLAVAVSLCATAAQSKDLTETAKMGEESYSCLPPPNRQSAVRADASGGELGRRGRFAPSLEPENSWLRRRDNRRRPARKLQLRPTRSAGA